MKTTMISAACAIAAALALMPAGASAQGTDTTRSSTRDSSSMTRPTTASTNQNRISGAISDSAIIAMLQLSDTEEIAAADLAMTKASSDRVKRFAEELKTDHSKALQELQAYAQRMSNGGSSGMASGMAGSQSRRDSTSIASPMHHDSA
ncbi:MAG: DUF4142 domain-containing protein, partial [Gemmatimonadota bacterium]